MNNIGMTNDGGIVLKNRAFRRKRKTTSELEGKSRNFYTKKQNKQRKKNGKTIRKWKKAR